MILPKGQQERVNGPSVSDPLQRMADTISHRLLLQHLDGIAEIDRRQKRGKEAIECFFSPDQLKSFSRQAPRLVLIPGTGKNERHKRSDCVTTQQGKLYDCFLAFQRVPEARYDIIC